MNDDTPSHNPLEEQLSALRPRQLSDGFAQRLGERLERQDGEPQGRRPLGTRFFLPVAAIAVLILVALWLVQNFALRENPLLPKQEIVMPGAESHEPPPPQTPGPTLFAYSQAIASGNDGLDELLDRHAATLLPDVPVKESAGQRWPSIE